MFRKAVPGLQQERPIVVVDALDEGDQAGVRTMVEYLESLAEGVQAKKISLEACYASRHYLHITAKSCESMIVEDSSVSVVKPNTQSLRIFKAGERLRRCKLCLMLVRMSML
jgi:hypothetical protein